MDTTYTPPVADLDARRSRALIVGVVGLVVCAIGFVVDRDHFFRVWLIAYMLFLGIALGSMALMMIQHLSGGALGRLPPHLRGVEPDAAAAGAAVPAGRCSAWARSTRGRTPTTSQADEILRHKAPYLNTPFFLVRAVVLLRRLDRRWRWLLNRLSARQDDGRRQRQHAHPAAVAAPAWSSTR